MTIVSKEGSIPFKNSLERTLAHCNDHLATYNTPCSIHDGIAVATSAMSCGEDPCSATKVTRCCKVRGSMIVGCCTLWC